jgi:hypothetical protein
MKLDTLMKQHGPEVVIATINAAKRGDSRAQEIILKRIYPERKGRPIVGLEIPQPKTLAEIPNAILHIAGYVLDGTISPEEGEQLANTMDKLRQSYESADLEIRLHRLEQNEAPATTGRTMDIDVE